jgi:hypothetical protein
VLCAQYITKRNVTILHSACTHYLRYLLTRNLKNKSHKAYSPVPSVIILIAVNKFHLYKELNTTLKHRTRLGALIFEVSRSHSDTTVGRNLREKWSAHRRDLYLTTHNTNKRQTSMPPAGFGPAIPASEQPQTHALDREATVTGSPTTH